MSYQLLIVDDEVLIRKALSQYIDWESLNCVVHATASNGKEAIKIIEENKIDIVITDVKMPLIDGIELSRYICKNHPNITTVILSGYAEFDYAKRAMKSGVKHYLLKPCDEEQLRSALQEMVSECLQLKQEKNLSPVTIQDAQIQHVMLLNLIREGIRLPNVTTKLFEINAPYLELYEQPFQYCAIYYLEKKFINSAMEQLRRYWTNTSQNICFHAIYTVNVLLLIFPDYTRDYSSLDDFLSTLHFPDQKVSIVYERKTFPNLEKLLLMLLPKLKRYDTFYFVEEDHLIPNSNYDLIFSDVSLITQKLLQEHSPGDDRSIIEIEEELHNILLSVGDKDFLIQLASQLLISLSIETVSGDIKTVSQTLSRLHNEDNLTNICNITMNEIYQITDTSSNGKYSPFIQKIINYVDDHISEENMTLKGISENILYMNASYVSRIFVKEVGQTFSSYVTEHRIEKAKEILSGTSVEQIQNVATLVGCGNNPYYFSKIFKKVTGMTPTIYARRFGTSPHN